LAVIQQIDGLSSINTVAIKLDKNRS